MKIMGSNRLLYRPAHFNMNSENPKIINGLAAVAAISFLPGTLMCMWLTARLGEVWMFFLTFGFMSVCATVLFISRHRN